MTTGFQITRRAALAVIVAFPAAASQTDWARPLDMPGVPNLHQVTPQIYRSAQPNALGFQNLANLGIKTVINLRRTVDDSPLAAGTGLDLIHIKITTRHVSDDNSGKIVRAMQALRDAQAKAPVLLHCTHGADRTGLIMALWRILFQGWSREAALDELINGGFGFHHVWINIPQYLRKVDLIDLKARIDAGA
jgi:protein tyrosine/serine phosphatase